MKYESTIARSEFHARVRFGYAIGGAGGWYLCRIHGVTGRSPTSARGGDTRSHGVDECAKIGRG